jgi:hypothetical protein
VFRRLDQTLESGMQMTAGDVDLDGNQDLVVGNVLYLNAGGGRFEKVQTFDLGDLPIARLLVDIDKDVGLTSDVENRLTGTTAAYGAAACIPAFWRHVTRDSTCLRGLRALD